MQQFPGVARLKINKQSLVTTSVLKASLTVGPYKTLIKGLTVNQNLHTLSQVPVSQIDRLV